MIRSFSKASIRICCVPQTKHPCGDDGVGLVEGKEQKGKDKLDEENRRENGCDGVRLQRTVFCATV